MKEYIAKKAHSEMKIDDSRWDNVESVILDYVWENAFPSPYETKAQVVHTETGITVRLTTNEWPITVTAMERNGQICIDSCMEFFFIPNTVDADYINIEMNPAAVFVTAKGASRGMREKLLDDGEGFKVTSMINGGEGWTVMASISYAYLLKQYSCVEKTMRANFYKCGDLTPTVHYSAWNPVETENPDYHRPEYFGKIILSEDLIS